MAIDCARTAKLTIGARRAAACLICLFGFVTQAVSHESRLSGTELEDLRRSGNHMLQRRHAWVLLEELTRQSDGGDAPAFESWWGEGAAFARSATAAVPGIRGFERAVTDVGNATAGAHEATASGNIPVLAYTLYNQAAYDHIRRHRLHLRDELQRLRDQGPPDNSMPERRSVPTFPAESMVLKTAWWPVAARGVTPLPVWDAGLNPPRRAGNDILTWNRIVAVSPFRQTQHRASSRMEFAGRSFSGVRQVRLDNFFHVTIDDDLAGRLARDSSATKLALLVLGQPVRAGDHLVLVGANLATREIADWIWAAYWWHDHGASGPFAEDRPAGARAPWRNFLMQVAFDERAPLRADGSPHICFNPWLEARFADGGGGGGVVSNCLACHRRASFPPAAFLPVTRGTPDLNHDAAYERGRLGVNFNWSLALHALR